MADRAQSPSRWWARGLLFENCNCQVICPGHVHFSQACTEERCLGYWALRFDEGEFDGVPLAGLRAVILYDAPSHMIEGDWTEAIVVDQAATDAQRAALETLLTGRAGGPWEVLARFVGKWLPTRYLPVRIEEEGPEKRVSVDGLLAGSIEDLRGRDRSRPVTLGNMFNQIHAPEQVVARGSTRSEGSAIAIDTEGTHGLYSTFDWRVGVE